MTVTDNWYSERQATLGDRLAAAREAAGLSQSALAMRLGVRQKTLRSWEEDQSEPRANRLQMLAAMLGVSLRWLLTGEGEGVSPPAPSDESGAAALVQALAELRVLRGELLKASERMVHLEKTLRRQIEAGLEPA
jgi:HTH-type transcriptional regulator, cell division transcriptional repressor